MNEVLNFITSVCVSAVALALGIVLLWGYSIFARQERRQSNAELLEQELVSRQMARNGEKIYQLEVINTLPNINGRLSPEKQAAWDRYHYLDRIDKELTKQERNAIVEAYGGYTE